jgi:DNA-binding winged helix-turn-helix (wHTH) protein/Tol biopolymer transport system component
MSLNAKELYRFEGFELDPVRRVLSREDGPVLLTPKAFDVLAYLVLNPGRVVTKDELLKAIWPDSFVEEGNLAQYISSLRKALGDKSRLIATISGRGYQLGAQVFTAQTLTEQAPIVLPDARPGDIFVQRVRERTRLVYEDVPAFQLASHQTASLNAGTTSSRRRTWQWIAVSALGGALIATAALAVYFGMRLNGAVQMRISNYAQITHDGNTKFIGGTDGSRIYFTQELPRGIAEVSVSGGAVAQLPVLQPNPWAGDVSPDGSTLLLISEAGGLGPANSLWSLRLLGGSLRHLANAINSTWSPDGEKIAYATVSGEICVMPSDGGEARRIASPGGYVKSLAWSPDGGAIRFSKEGILWEMSSSGSNLHQLLPGWKKSPSQWNGQWAQDGRFYFVADGQIWVLDERPGFGKSLPAAPVQLTFGPMVWDRPIPSRDGKKIFASGRTNRGELVRLDTKSRQFQPFLAGISAEFLTYSSDAKSIAYVTFPEGILWRANPDGSHPTQLTYPPVYPKSIRWSPDGTQILFVDRTPQGHDAIYIIPADGSGKPRRLLPEDREAETDPSWSADGTKIVFSTSPNVGASSKSDLRILDFATGNVAALPASDGLVVPHWSPDGLSIAAMTLDTMAMKVFDIANGRWTKLDSGAVAFPEWSHDSRFIYYVKWAGDQTVNRIRIADGKREVVADMKGARYTGVYTLWMGLDPADTPLLLHDIGSDDIYALTLERK